MCIQYGKKEIHFQPKQKYKNNILFRGISFKKEWLNICKTFEPKKSRKNENITYFTRKFQLTNKNTKLLQVKGIKIVRGSVVKIHTDESCAREFLSEDTRVCVGVRQFV